MKEIPLRQIAAQAVADYQRKLALIDARETIRCLGVSQGHTLGTWRVLGAEGEEVALIQCQQCGEGARLHLATATARLSGEFTQTCPGLPRRA